MIRRFIKTVYLPIRKKAVRVAFEVLKYPNDNTAIELFKPTLCGYEDYDTLTINTGDIFPKEYACIDTNHHGEEIVSRLEKLKFGKRMDWYCVSGYCQYPVFHFDLNQIKKYSILKNTNIY